MIKNGKIFTPPISTSILEGITRASAIQIARDQGYDVSEQNIAKSQLYTCDEFFFTGTAVEITPVLEVDRRKIGDGKIGPVTNRIKEAYAEIVSGNSSKYKSWLTEVY